MFRQMNLKLGSTKRYFGFGDKDDHVLLDGGRVIGRIFQQPQAPEVARGSGQSLHASIRHQFIVAAIQRRASKRWRISKVSG